MATDKAWVGTSVPMQLSTHRHAMGQAKGGKKETLAIQEMGHLLSNNGQKSGGKYRRAGRLTGLAREAANEAREVDSSSWMAPRACYLSHLQRISVLLVVSFDNAPLSPLSLRTSRRVDSKASLLLYTPGLH